MLDSSSRYYQLEDAVYETANGSRITYKRRRFLPQGFHQPLLAYVTVAAGDRLDVITTRALGAPEHFWRICDANNALNPFDLTDEIGMILRVSPPQL